MGKEIDENLPAYKKRSKTGENPNTISFIIIVTYVT